MEQDGFQKASCPDHGIQEILSVTGSHLINKDPIAYSTLAKLACGETIRIIMSEKNLDAVYEQANMRNEN